MRQRARAAFAQTSRRGCVMWDVPVGCVRTEDHRLAKSADRQVQHALAGVFTKCHDLGSARQTLLWDRAARLPRPEVHPGTAGHASSWPLPSGPRLHQRRTHPCDAGARVYGRTATKPVLEEGRARQSTRQQQPLEQWRMVRREPHPGDLSWDVLLHHPPRLEANRAMPEAAAGGAANRGPAWRSGWLRGGRCGRKLQVG
jgi:hypothetical protein